MPRYERAIRRAAASQLSRCSWWCQTMLSTRVVGRTYGTGGRLGQTTADASSRGIVIGRAAPGDGLWLRQGAPGDQHQDRARGDDHRRVREVEAPPENRTDWNQHEGHYRAGEAPVPQQPGGHELQDADGEEPLSPMTHEIPNPTALTASRPAAMRSSSTSRWV